MAPTQQAVYHVFGLNVASDLPFLDMPQQPGVPDVIVRYGEVPDSIPDAKSTGVRYQAAPGAFLLEVDGVARYHVTGGNDITIERDSEAQDEEVFLFLMGSVMGALLHQRQMLPLHAGAIAVDHKAVLFAGPSGIGKSTLTAAFQQRGFPVLADDLCGITVDQNQEIKVVAGFAQLRLWEDSLDKLAQSSDGLRRVRKDPDFKKFFVPIKPPKPPALPIRSLFILGNTNEDRFEILELKGIDQIDPVINHTYRPRFLEGLDHQKSHFLMCSLLANHARIIKLSRPEMGFRLDELMDLVEDHW